MNQEIREDDIYANARIDAGVAEALAGNGKPFWISAQTNLIRWVRIGHRLAGEPEPGIRSVAETAKNRAKLETLVKKAASRAETTDEMNEARELERWLTHDWLPLDTVLVSSQTRTLTRAGSEAQKTTVTSRDGARQTHIGERTGSWDLWDPASLPEKAAKAAYDAMRELRVKTRRATRPNRTREHRAPGKRREPEPRPQASKQ